MFKSIIGDFGITILCPERNLGGLRSTSLCCRSLGKKCICIVGAETTNTDINALSHHCPVYCGGYTITSLIDEGIRRSQTEWTLIIVAGAVLKINMLKKYEYFTRTDKDILFPVVDRRFLFHEGSINGILVNKKVIEDVGFINDEEGDIVKAKLYWWARAVEKGYKFKSLVGVRFF